MATQSLTLQPSGHKMPLLGLGTWKIPKDVAADTVYKVEVGQGIKRAIDAGIVKREDLFITSKLWNTYHHKEHVPMAFHRTLSDLGLDYIDLYLIHFPISLKYVPFEERYPPEWGNMEQDPVPIHETWAAMEELVKSGKVRDIGVSNFSAILLMDLLSYAKVKPAVLHIEVHPYLNNSNLIRYHPLFTNYDNYLFQLVWGNVGLLRAKVSILMVYPSYVELGNSAAQTTVPLFKEERLTKIAAAHKKTAAQIILRWLVQNKIAVIPKSSDPARIAQNADIFSFELMPEEMAIIDGMNIPLRLNDPGVYANIPIYA
ncbi:NAD(P)H-dependent D-xylose reductase (XR) [Linnemannia zychae]|nr:NAD(P)H-dependent D-xylose reductase (XR) [Linnemannia zychae]